MSTRPRPGAASPLDGRHAVARRALVGCAVLLLLVTAVACGDGRGADIEASAGKQTLRSGDLLVRLAVAPRRVVPRQPVRFVIHARQPAAPGPLSYQVDYGDGHTDENVVAQFCRGGDAPTETEDWQLDHRYAHDGTYRATVTVIAGCTPNRAVGTVTIRVG